MNKLDLHGKRHHEIDRDVENFVLLNQNNIPLTIICGNSNKMIELVKLTLTRLDCQFIMYNYGTITVLKI